MRSMDGMQGSPAATSARHAFLVTTSLAVQTQQPTSRLPRL